MLLIVVMVSAAMFVVLGAIMIAMAMSMLFFVVMVSMVSFIPIVFVFLFAIFIDRPQLKSHAAFHCANTVKLSEQFFAGSTVSNVLQFVG